MECVEALEAADSLLSGQLPADANRQILNHLETCAACRAVLAERRRLRDILRQAILRTPRLAPTGEFTTRLHEALQNALRRLNAPPRSS